MLEMVRQILPTKIARRFIGKLNAEKIQELGCGKSNLPFHSDNLGAGWNKKASIANWPDRLALYLHLPSSLSPFFFQKDIFSS